MVPKLRFSLFNSQWNAISLGNIIKIKSGQGFKAEEYAKPQNINKVRLLQIENVGYGITKWTDNVKYLPSDYLSSYKELALDKGDIVLALNRPITNNQLKITTLKSEDVPSILYQRVGKFIFLESGICKQFYYQMFQEKIKEFVLLNSIGSDQPFISLTTLYRYEVYSTTPCEQTKIADFLSSVDEKIMLLSKQHELLCQYKKGMMQKIFSQELRFQDENGEKFPDWNELPLGKVGEVITGNTPSTSVVEYWNGDILFTTPTDMDDSIKYLTETERKVTSKGIKRVLPKGTVMFTCIASIGKMALSTHQCVTNQQINSIIVNEKFNNEFIYYYLQYIKPQIISNQANTTVPIVNKSDFSAISIQIPNLVEQTKVAHLLSTIDDKITIKKTELNKLKTWKQGLLQQMFI